MALTASDTESVCPVCLDRVPAAYVHEGGAVYLSKRCPAHGAFSTLIWQGPPWFAQWRRPKTPHRPRSADKPIRRGCPYDCGLCTAHRQRTCTVLVEVTPRCDLGCPVCYAGAGDGREPDTDTAAGWIEGAAALAKGANLQLSGGEPTLREDLDVLIAAARGAGFAFVQINTNGRRFARDPSYARQMADAGAAGIFLQFDGTDDGIYRRIRGRALVAEKSAAIDACIDAGLGVVLVSTLVPGVNTADVGAMVDFALRRSPGVRGIHFQPVSYFGRHPSPPAGGYRLTLPEVMRLVSGQTDGRLPLAAWSPPGCENARCSFHGNFVLMPGHRLVPLSTEGGGRCCGPPESAEAGALRAIAATARRWAAPPNHAAGPSVADAGPGWTDDAVPLDDFLSAARQGAFSVSAMAFQDAWTLDLERLRDCCIHVYDPERGLVPFCAYNLTAAGGRHLYRP